MKKILISILALSLALAMTAAVPNFTPWDNPGGHTVSIPENAEEVAPGIFFLGTAIHEGKLVEGYAAFHHKNGHDGGPPGSGGDDGDSTSSCFAFLANGAKWNTVEDYIVDPTNNEGLTSQFISDTLAQGLSDWEDATDGSLDGVSQNIMGDEVGSASDVDGADEDSPDGKNEVMFGDVDSSGAIAVTIVWGTFRGPPRDRGLVEWDQVYDQVDFDWSDSGEAGKMDFENIADHELGHAFGLGHPSNDCTEETMYAFASEGEINKRDLHAGDIAGSDELY